nr:protein 2b [Alphamesonivirus sp.]
MPAQVSGNNNNNAQGTPKQQRPKQNSQNGNSKTQRKGAKPQRQTQQQPGPSKVNNNNSKDRRATTQGQQQQVAKTKKPIATGPNYTETDGKLYKIGKEFDARNHMGWRRNEKNGSSIQFLFKPKMASRIDQAYYRNQFEDADHYVHTFGVGVFVQDSTLERNAVYNHQKLTTEEKDDYVRKLSDAFNAILLRTRQAFDNGNRPALTIDAA